MSWGPAWIRLAARLADRTNYADERVSAQMRFYRQNPDIESLSPVDGHSVAIKNFDISAELAAGEGHIATADPDVIEWLESSPHFVLSVTDEDAEPPPPPPPPPPPNPYPPLKVSLNSTSYRSAPATEIRNAMGITSGFLVIGNVSDVSKAGPPGSGFSSMLDFWLGELEYIGIRQLRSTPQPLQPKSMQFCREWATTSIGAETGKLLVEPGKMVNGNSANNPRCSGVFDSGCCSTIDWMMSALLSDADIRSAINTFEVSNEPNNFEYYAGVGGVANGPGTDGRTWLQCLGEKHKKIWNYVVNDARAENIQVVGACPTANHIDDSEYANNVVDGLDVATQWGSTEPYCHFGNDHPYCGHLRPGPTFTVNTTHGVNAITDGWPGLVPGHGAWPSRRQMPTEFGYNVAGRPGISPWWAQLPNWDIYANYLLRAYLELIIRGGERLYWFTLDPQGFALPRGPGQAPPDDFSIYAWDSASPRYWWHRTQAVEALHRFTSNIGDGTSQPNLSWSLSSPSSDLLWLMSRRTTPSAAHVLNLWRAVHIVQQAGVPLGQHNGTKPPPQPVTVAPVTQRLLLPDAAQAILKCPVDGSLNQTLTFSGSGGTRGVDIPVDGKVYQVMIT